VVTDASDEAAQQAANERERVLGGVVMVSHPQKLPVRDGEHVPERASIDRPLALATARTRIRPRTSTVSSPIGGRHLVRTVKCEATSHAGLPPGKRQVWWLPTAFRRENMP
jgi:hypothetical protein